MKLMLKSGASGAMLSPILFVIFLEDIDESSGAVYNGKCYMLTIWKYRGAKHWTWKLEVSDGRYA